MWNLLCAELQTNRINKPAGSAHVLSSRQTFSPPAMAVYMQPESVSTPCFDLLYCSFASLLHCSLSLSLSPQTSLGG